MSTDAVISLDWLAKLHECEIGIFCTKSVHPEAMYFGLELTIMTLFSAHSIAPILHPFLRTCNAAH